MTIRTGLNRFSSMSPVRAIRARAGTLSSDVGEARPRTMPALLSELAKRPAIFGMSTSNSGPERGQASSGDYLRFQLRVFKRALDEGATVQEAAEQADEAARKYRYGEVDDETRNEIDEAGTDSYELSASNDGLRRLIGRAKRKAADVRDRLACGTSAAFA